MTTSTAEGSRRWPEPVYLDASALVKLFVPEADSDALNHQLEGLSDVVLPDLAMTELASALSRRMREGVLASADARRVYAGAVRLHATLQSAELTPPVHRRAERLMLSQASPLRALDALHLATALVVGAETIVTFDARLRAAAESQGLFVAP